MDLQFQFRKIRNSDSQSVSSNNPQILRITTYQSLVTIQRSDHQFTFSPKCENYKTLFEHLTNNLQ